MKTLHLAIDAAAVTAVASVAAIESAAVILRRGGTVAFPTETVYGLGANALDIEAVRKIFVAKQRPHWDPLIVHVTREMMNDVVSAISPNAQLLMNAFWPGPLTLLLPKTPRVPRLVTAGRALIGVRMPSHPVAMALIRAAGLPIAAPSANIFGHVSPTSSVHVLQDLDGLIDAVLDGGETDVGLESTVVDASGPSPILYRYGAVTLEQIRSICPDTIAFGETAAASAEEPASLPSPGLGMRHYAPRARLVLIDGEGEKQRQDFAAAVADATTATEKVGVMLPGGFAGGTVALSYAWGSWSDGDELAHRLFAGLRALDAAGATVIVCPLPGPKGIGAAIRDRLLKAARTS